MRISTKQIIYIILFLAILVSTPMLFGINDAGHRTVVQYPSGTLKVKFSPGIYPQWFGSVEKYNDVLTFDFDKNLPGNDDNEDVSINQDGSVVRYQDGGLGTIFGKGRFSLPADVDTMLKLHKAFRSNAGVAQKLIKTVSEEAMNLTAGLMTSEEAYAEKRSIYTQWAHEQIAKGKFVTLLSKIDVTDESTGKTISKNVPVIDYGKDGLPKHFPSDLQEYGVTLNGFQITDWDFEEKTLNQISTKREATMAIITSKANAERAKQDAITAEEQGKANVMTAKYDKEVEKVKHELLDLGKERDW